MSSFSDLSIRMKEYEHEGESYLERKKPVILRVDGKAFHTFTKGMKRPFDDILIGSMQDTMKFMCENIQGCVLGYHQSDEITLILQDYKTPETDAWFGYRVSKCASVAASMATTAFKRFLFRRVFYAYCDKAPVDAFVFYLVNDKGLTLNDISPDVSVYLEAIRSDAMFDARIFNLPFDEVCNNLVWRQVDAVRNSIQMVGQSNFSHKQLHGKSCNDIKSMLETEKGIDWNAYSTHYQRGSCCIKESYILDSELSSGPVLRNRWVVDKEIPIFTENREYVEGRVYLRDLE